MMIFKYSTKIDQKQQNLLINNKNKDKNHGKTEKNCELLQKKNNR